MINKIRSQSVRSLIWLWLNLSPTRKKQFSLLIFLSVITTLAELGSIGMIIPLITAAIPSDNASANGILRWLFEVAGQDQNSRINFFLATFICFALGAGFLRIWLLKITTGISFGAGSEISSKIFQAVLMQPYEIHMARNTSLVIDAVVNKVHAVIYGVIMGSSTLFVSIVMASIIFIGISISNPVLMPLISIAFLLAYASVVFYTKKTIYKNSEAINLNSENSIKAIQEGLGGIRDVLIDGTQKIFHNNYKLADMNLRNAQANNYLLGMFPRMVLEPLSMVLMALLIAIFSLSGSGLVQMLPTLSFIALGSQKILPIMQQIYSSLTGLIASIPALQDLVAIVEAPRTVSHSTEGASINFSNYFKLKNISYSYAGQSNPIFNDVTITIKKGERIGVIGKTGSGKSTLVDLISGLLIPSSGYIEVDGNGLTPDLMASWQKNIAYVSQATFLADSSVEENIAFGQPRELINYENVYKAATKARLADFINHLPQKYKTSVGERGVMLSGGQRQRIGIARALYKNAKIIIFDEATSALDEVTESEVMESIKALSSDITIILISHRLSTLRNCDRILKIESGDAIEFLI